MCQNKDLNRFFASRDEPCSALGEVGKCHDGVLQHVVGRRRVSAAVSSLRARHCRAFPLAKSCRLSLANGVPTMVSSAYFPRARSHSSLLKYSTGAAVWTRCQNNDLSRYSASREYSEQASAAAGCPANRPAVRRLPERPKRLPLVLQCNRRRADLFPPRSRTVPAALTACPPRPCSSAPRATFARHHADASLPTPAPDDNHLVQSTPRRK